MKADLPQSRKVLVLQREVSEVLDHLGQLGEQEVKTVSKLVGDQ